MNNAMVNSRIVHCLRSRQVFTSINMSEEYVSTISLLDLVKKKWFDFIIERTKLDVSISWGKMQKHYSWLKDTYEDTMNTGVFADPIALSSFIHTRCKENVSVRILGATKRCNTKIGSLEEICRLCQWPRCLLQKCSKIVEVIDTIESRMKPLLKLKNLLCHLFALPNLKEKEIYFQNLINLYFPEIEINLSTSTSSLSYNDTKLMLLCSVLTKKDGDSISRKHFSEKVSEVNRGIIYSYTKRQEFKNKSYYGTLDMLVAMDELKIRIVADNYVVMFIEVSNAGLYVNSSNSNVL